MWFSGAFVFGTKLFFFAGTLMKAVPEPNNFVVSINLESENLDLEKEPYYFPYTVNDPLSGSNSKRVIIVGGQTFDSQNSTACYVFTRKKGFIEAKNKISVSENFPPKCTEDYVIVVSFPKIHVKFKNSEGWAAFNIAQKNSLAPAKKLIPLNAQIGHGPLYRKATFAIDTDTMNSKFMTCSTSQHKFFNSLPSKISKNKEFGFTSRDEYEENLFTDRIEKEILHRNKGFDESKKEDIISNKRLVESLDFGSGKFLDDDEVVKVLHKQALKYFSLAVDKLDLGKVTAIRMNQISQVLGFKELVSIADIRIIMEELLTQQNYSSFVISSYIKIIHKVIDKPRLRSSAIFDIFDILLIPRNTSHFTKEQTISLITQVIKYTSIERI